jgi:hypothetical protein
MAARCGRPWRRSGPGSGATGGRGALYEQNTKVDLTRPLLRALGWNVEDLDEVQRECKVKRGGKHVDCALLLVPHAAALPGGGGLGRGPR